MDRKPGWRTADKVVSVMALLGAIALGWATDYYYGPGPMMLGVGTYLLGLLRGYARAFILFEEEKEKKA